MKIYSLVSIKPPDETEDTLRKSRSLWTLSQHDLALETLLESLYKDPFYSEGWIQASKWLYSISQNNLNKNAPRIFKYLARGIILDQSVASTEIAFYNTIKKCSDFKDDEEIREFISKQQKWFQDKTNEMIKDAESDVQCLCVKCGEMKWHMIVRCSKCGFFPKSEKDIFNTYNLRVVKIDDKYATDYLSKSKILRGVGKDILATCNKLESDPIYFSSLNSFFNSEVGKETYSLANRGISKKEEKIFKKFIKHELNN